MADFTAATITTPGAGQARELRRHQGIPGVEILPDGTLFVCFYANNEPGEGPGNYALVARSRDNGRSWREVTCIVPLQNEPAELYENHCADNMSCAMHECISRFFENIIGRSEEFLRFVSPKLRELSGDTFADVTDRELYEAVNVARPSLNRMNADELTYCIHIMIRYEIEKKFMNGEIAVDEIPALWSEKYKEYLGVDVPNDEEGCLQDVHWTGMFGYFPSYALGNAYGAQILRAMQKDFDVFAAAGRGDLKTIGDWLTEHVFSIASMTTPDEWIRAITGEPLNVDYYLDYLEEKFTALYEIG